MATPQLVELEKNYHLHERRTPHIFCPRCLLAVALQPTEGTERQPPSTLAEVSAAFPQLEILGLIGQGGMGWVFKACQPKLDRLVALKLLPASLAALGG